MPETWRLGRKSGHNIYLQTGDQPSDRDRQIGVMFDPAHAAAAVAAVNGVGGLDAERVDRALRHVIARLDYDLHKELDGEDDYAYPVAEFIGAYEKDLNDV